MELHAKKCVCVCVCIFQSKKPRWVAYVYLVCVFFVLSALFSVSCRDPGLMERVTDEEAGEGGWFWNEQVGSFRPPGALYCRECGVSHALGGVSTLCFSLKGTFLLLETSQVLIQGYDHLCPWTGTGIGEGNMLAFKCFVGGVNILCYFTIGLVAFVLLDGLLTT